MEQDCTVASADPLPLPPLLPPCGNDGGNEDDNNGDGDSGDNNNNGNYVGSGSSGGSEDNVGDSNGGGHRQYLPNCLPMMSQKVILGEKVLSLYPGDEFLIFRVLSLRNGH